LTRHPHKVVSSGEGIGVQQVLVSNRSGAHLVVTRPVSVINVRDGLNIEVHPDERGRKREHERGVGNESPLDTPVSAIDGIEQCGYTSEGKSDDNP
jgi:hypothetical protein